MGILDYTDFEIILVIHYTSYIHTYISPFYTQYYILSYSDRDPLTVHSTSAWAATVEGEKIDFVYVSRPSAISVSASQPTESDSTIGTPLGLN